MWLEFEFPYFEVAVQQIIHYNKGIPTRNIKWFLFLLFIH